jgi:hypothetical protein
VSPGSPWLSRTAPDHGQQGLTVVQDVLWGHAMNLLLVTLGGETPQSSLRGHDCSWTTAQRSWTPTDIAVGCRSSSHPGSVHNESPSNCLCCQNCSWTVPKVGWSHDRAPSASLFGMETSKAANSTDKAGLPVSPCVSRGDVDHG